MQEKKGIEFEVKQVKNGYYSGEYLLLSVFKIGDSIVFRAIESPTPKNKTLLYEIAKFAWLAEQVKYVFTEFYCTNLTDYYVDVLEFDSKMLLRLMPLCNIVSKEKYPRYSNTKYYMSSWALWVEASIYMFDKVEFKKNKRRLIWRGFLQ